MSMKNQVLDQMINHPYVPSYNPKGEEVCGNPKCGLSSKYELKHNWGCEHMIGNGTFACPHKH